MIPDGNLQKALSQLADQRFWDLDEQTLRSRLVAALRLHQAAPAVCNECLSAWPCSTQRILTHGGVL